MPKLKRILLEQSEYWRLARSIGCPDCQSALYGNGNHIWCKSHDCLFIGEWEDILNLCVTDGDKIFSEKMQGELIQSGKNVYVFWNDARYKCVFEKVE